MRRKLPVFIAFLLLVIPAHVFAKANTEKITIKGAGLKVPIEITDPKIVADFRVWTGPGTSGFDSNKPSFIVDWSLGPVAEPLGGLQQYEISFWAKSPEARIVYVVLYKYDPATKHGYVYLPGANDEWYQLNMGTIARDVEGKWFCSWSVWDEVASPLIRPRRDQKLNR